jgi:hypothetical protein
MWVYAVAITRGKSAQVEMGDELNDRVDVTSLSEVWTFTDEIEVW